MPQVELTLRPRIGPPAPAAAWYVPGAAPETWLEEVARWPVEHAQVRMVAVREGAGDSVSGALIIPPNGDFIPGGQCVAFARFCDHVYLPSDAQLFPSVSAAEARELFTSDYVYVWAPGRGLTAAELNDVLTPSDLITMASPAPTDWNRAQPGLAFPTRLVAILPREAITAESIIDDGRDDIGAQANEIDNLPPAPREPGSGIAGAIGRAAIIAAAKPLAGIGKVISAIGNVAHRGSGAAGAHGSSAFDAVGDMANRMLGRVSQSLDAMRHKEIGRLLHMLDSDPDQGLKFAIPFGGDDQLPRGVAPLSARLGSRDANFDLGRLGGGGPTDFWNLSWEYQQKLISKYRELAAREVRLGRHRRAAYVYAELLGDLRSAASILEQGGHFREAAVLYRDRLHNTEAAAACLERGELWNEAIDAYRGLGKHEKVGDLLTHIGQNNAARDAYRLAAEEELDNYDRLGAARIYVEKLRDANLALATLDEGWPDAPQATQCVHAGFTIRAQLGLHDAARERVDQLHADAEQFARHVEVAALLAEVAAKYPQRAIQQHALALGRNIIAGRMHLAGPSEAEQLAATLSRLTPDDRLLPRDGRRYLEKARAKSIPRLAAPSLALSSRQRLSAVHEVDLGVPGAWRTATTVAGHVYVAGIMEGRVIVAVRDDRGSVTHNLTVWPKIAVPSDADLILLRNRSPLYLFVVGQPPLPAAKLFDSAGEPQSLLSAGTPRGVGAVQGVALGASGRIWTLELRDDPVLVCTAEGSGVVWTRSLLEVAEAPWHDAVQPLPMCSARGMVLLGVGNMLIRAGRDDQAMVNLFARRIVSLAKSRREVHKIAAVALEIGASLIRPSGADAGQRFADELESPLVKFTRGGFVIAAGENKIEAYELKNLATSHPKLSLRRDADHQNGRPVAILEDAQTDRFVVVYATGKVTTYRL